MKKIVLAIIIMVCGVCFITGCGKKEKNNETEQPKTVAAELGKVFETAIKEEKDIEKVAKKIAESEIIVPEVQSFAINDGDYLAGFKEEITGYKKAVGIAPMISTIPMIAYVFEVEEPEAFSKTLEENADLRWNICIEAEEMKTVIVDNYVFFIMSPNNFEE